VSPTSGTEAPSRLRLQRARMGLLLHARAPAAATACGHGVGVGGRARELLQQAPGLASRSSTPAAMAATSARIQNSWLTLDGLR